MNLRFVTLRSVYPKVSDLWITVAREKCETYGDFTCKGDGSTRFPEGTMYWNPTKVQGVFAMPNMLGDLLSDAVTGKNGGMGPRAIALLFTLIH
jgi:isocitrate/isopropylmalate dehydrogenase